MFDKPRPKPEQQAKRQRRELEASGGREPSKEELLDDFDKANEEGHVMNKITLGGRMKKWEPNDPIYALGVFRESEFEAAYPNLSSLLVDSP